MPRQSSKVYMSDDTNDVFGFKFESLVYYYIVVIILVRGLIVFEELD